METSSANFFLMALFIPSKKPAAPESSKPHSYGHVTANELKKDVLGSLRRGGLNPQERAIVETAAEGHMDSQGFSSKGMDYREKEALIAELREDATKLGLERKDIDRIDDAFNRAL